MRKTENGDTFFKVKHKHDNQFASLGTHTLASLLFMLQHDERKPPINKLFRSKTLKTQQREYPMIVL